MQAIVLNAEGWGDILNNNSTKINNQVDSLIDPTKTVHPTATTQIINLPDTISAPAAVTAAATVSVTVSGTGDDPTINGNFIAIDAFTVLAVADLGNLRSTVISNQTILTNLVTKVNALLVEFREGSGIALLKL